MTALQNAATNAATIGSAIGSHPVNQLAGGDYGHAGVVLVSGEFQHGKGSSKKVITRG